MNKIITIISIVFITLSCGEDIFDRKPLDKISDIDVWDDPTLIRSYLYDVYSRMPFNTRYNTDWGGAMYNFLDSKTDIATSSKGNQDIITQGQMSRNNDPTGYWNYALIRDVNIFIERIVKADIADAIKNQMLGEAKVLRAMIYYEKQIRYGGVPLVDISLDPYSPIEQKYTERATEEAVADFIDSELNTAIEILSEDVKVISRINKWTAHAFKARANLWSASIAKYGTIQLNGMVGIPSSRANEFYQKASAAANAVILSGNYSLFKQHTNKSENYRMLFVTSNNGEEIFTKLFDGVNFYHEWNFRNLPQSLSGGYGAWLTPTYDYILASENIDGSPDQPLIGPDHLYDYALQAFENKDPRIHAVTVFDKDVVAGTIIRSYEGIDPSPVPNPDAILSRWKQYYMGMLQVAEDSRLNPFDDKKTSTGFMVKKFINGISKESDNNWMEFRLGEMFLIRAEAEFEQGNLGPAASALNETRARAGISLVNAATISLYLIRTERMSELAWENHRWWDLRRWRIAENVLNMKTFQGIRTIYHYDSGKIYFLPVNAEPSARIFLPHHYYNPITDSRLNNNVDLLENPGY